jgi:hypothetical protein
MFCERTRTNGASRKNRRGKFVMKKALLTIALTLLACATVFPQAGKPLLRKPTLSKTQIVFVYAG